MSKKIVKTIGGEDLHISQCRKYDKNYYKIGDIKIQNSGDCYKIDDKFYRVETGQVVFNYTTQEYCLKTNSLRYGLVDNNEKGYFNSSIYNITIVDETGSNIFAISEDVLLKNLNYREQLSTGIYVHISQLKAVEFNKINVPSKDYKHSLPYDSKGITDKYLKIYNSLYDSKLSLSIIDFSKLIGDLTFGLEFETIAGMLPSRISNKLGLIPLRDGSIEGLEYVSVPLSGAKGLQTIVDISKELKKRTFFDHRCALHLHIGNIPRTKEFILAFFKLSLFLQDEIFALFPIYKKYNMGIKNKNYSKPYPTYNIVSKMDPVINSSNLNKNFSILFDYLSEQEDSFYHSFNNDLNNVHCHPKDPGGAQKWNIKTRYYFHNFIPLIFGNRQTIEFRIHTPTYDIFKILMFLGLNSMLINFTSSNCKNILEDPNFLNNHVNLLNLIKTHLQNEDRKGIFKKNNVLSLSSTYDIFRNYIEKRKAIIEKLTAQGKIVIEEEDISLKSNNLFCDERIIPSDYNPEIKLDENLLIQELETVDNNKVIKKSSYKPYYSQYTDSLDDFGSKPKPVITNDELQKYHNEGLKKMAEQMRILNNYEEQLKQPLTLNTQQNVVKW